MMNKNKLNEVYERYKHLDPIITNLKCDTFLGQMIHDMWTAIKETARSTDE
jgi:hypothetical protein